MVCLRLDGAFAKFQTAPLHRRHTVHLSANEERTKRAVNQIPVGALLFVVGALVGVALATIPIRERVNLSGAFPPDFFNLVGLGSLTWRACLLSSPLYVWLARRWPIYEQHWRRNFIRIFSSTRCKAFPH